MKFHKMTWLAAPALFALSVSAQAGIVDLFSTDQALMTDTTANGVGLSSSVNDGGAGTILGEERDLFVSLLDTGGNAFANASMGVGGGAMSFNVSSQATGTGAVQWDGYDNSPNLAMTGLGGIDLTEGGTLTHFAVETLFSDLGYEFVVGAYTDATNWTEISFSAHAVATATTSYIAFSGFTNSLLCGAVNPAPGVNSITCGGAGTVDLTNLGALEFLIDPNGGTTSVDLTLDAVTTVPEPSVLGLMGAGLLAGGLAGMVRRKKAKA